MRDKDKKIARSAPLLSGLGDELFNDILDGAPVQELSRGETIFLQGEQARAIYIVTDGWVKLYRLAPSGAEAVVGVLTKGQSFGEAVAFRNDCYPVSAESATASRMIRIEAGRFLRRIEENPAMATAIISATFTHLHALVNQVEALKARTGAQRVAEFLLELVECDLGSCEVKLPYDKVLIAGRLGMTPESLSRAFVKLRDFGVAIRHNHASIDEVTTLRDFAEDNTATR
ncbi:MAG: Crp/Fnr family transcriptional regulator [Pseudorhodobacter sp.]